MRLLRRLYARAVALTRGRRWLFLDDTRDPPEHISKVFDTVRSHVEFTEWVDLNGVPDLVSFDHDLHAEHVSFFFDKGGFRNPPDPTHEIFFNPTGYDSAKWLAKRCVETGRYPEYVIVHSNNPVGGDRIYSLFTGLTESRNTGTKCRKTRWGVNPKR
jgi:hypothetical protein